MRERMRMRIKRHGLTAFFAACALALAGFCVAWADDPSTNGGGAAPSARAADVTITDEGQLADLFPDPSFRKVVFEAVKDGAEGAKGTSVEDALAHFTGFIYANGYDLVEEGMSKIKDIHGIECLSSVTYVDFSDNDVTDLSFLGKDKTEPNKKFYLGTDKLKKNLHGADKNNINENNITWRLDGNPFINVPAFFGGRLVVQQAATSFSEYPELDNELQFYVRKGDGAVSGTLHVGKVKDNDGNFVEIDASTVSDIEGQYPMTLTYRGDNDTVDFTDLVRSGKHDIAVGTGEIFHYSSADNKDTMTDGGQSYKYYMSPSFFVYDKVTMTQNAHEGAVQLTKRSEADDTPLAGAEYSLYLDGDDVPLKTGLTTGADGTLLVTDLEPGSYRLVETKPPDGYLINDEPIAFSIASVHATLAGGKKTLDNLTDGTTATAGDNEVFIAGPADDDGNSPDIVLALDDPATANLVDSVKVVYSKLDGATGSTTASFDTLDAAQADVNAKKNANAIIGPVKIEVACEQLPVGSNLTKVEQKDKPFVQESIDIEGTKTWVDNDGWDGVRPEVTIHLLRNGIDTGKTAKLPASSPSKTTADDKGVAYVPNNGTVTYRFAGLDKYDPANGRAYTYSVREDPVTITDPGTGNVNSYIPSYTGCDITNTWPDGTLVNIKGAKRWDDFEDAAGKRPDHVIIQLYQNDGTGDTLYREETVTAANGWEYRFDLVPKFVDKDESALYTYTVKESPVDGYEAPDPVVVDTKDTVDKHDAPDAVIVNTFKNDIASVSGTKAWKGDDPEARPTAIEVELLRNGAPLVPAKTATATEAGGWRYSFGGLDKYDATTNREYAYTVREAAVPSGYASEVTGSASEGFVITNTWVNPSLSIVGTKVWKDDDNKGSTRPQSIEVNLLRNGEVADSQTVSAAEGWRYSFDNLPTYDDKGKKYAYAVEEAAVPAGYTSTVSDDSATITNTLIPSTAPPSGETPSGGDTPPSGNTPTGGDPSPKEITKTLVNTGDPLSSALCALALAGAAAVSCALFAWRRRA